MKRIISSLLMVVMLAVASCEPVYCADIKPALVETFGNEGGYTVDSGGPTNWGISQKAYPNLSTEHIKNMKVEEAAGLYERDYWDPLGLGKCPNQIIANEIFDSGVNEGSGTAARRIQQAINLSNGFKADIKVDGKLGTATWNAWAQCDLIEFYVNWIILRGTRYQKLAEGNSAKYQQYFKSWTYRLKNNVAKAVHEYETLKHALPALAVSYKSGESK